ncbi:MAG: DEAD/DEAH box helicase family protein, partial [Candidatus Hydrogenedentales bacterium]
MAVPVFDPAQPFEEVSEIPSAGASLPQFDPTKPFEPVADLPKFDPAQPFEPVSALPPRAGRSLRFTGPPAAPVSNVSVNAPPVLAMPVEPPQAANTPEQIKEQTWATLTPAEKAQLDLARGGRAGIEGAGMTAKGFGIASTVLPPVSAFDMGGPYNPAEAELISRWQEKRARQTPAEIKAEIQANPAFQAGERIQAVAERTFPSVQPKSVSRPLGALAEGVGSTVSFLPGGLVGPMGVALLGALQNGAGAYDEAVKMGAPHDKAVDAFLINAIGGTSEALPISHIFQRINRASGGTLGRAIRDMVVSGLEEGTQEIFQQVLQNTAAKHLYDKEREYLEGVLQSGGVGFGTGFLLSALGIGTHKIAERTGRAIRERKPNAIETEQKPGGVPIELPRVDEVGQAVEGTGVGNRVTGAAGQPTPEAQAQGPVAEATPETLAGLTPQKGKLGRQGWMTSTDPAVRMSVKVDTGGILLNSIEAVQPGTGAGTAAIRRLMTLADATGKPLTLTAEALSKEKQAGLEAFYGRLGFQRTDVGEFIYQPVPKLQTPVLPPLRAGERMVLVQRPDGTSYPAAYAGTFYDFPGRGRLASVATLKDGKWSHGMLLPGETIVGEVIPTSTPKEVIPDEKVQGQGQEGQVTPGAPPTAAAPIPSSASQPAKTSDSDLVVATSTPTAPGPATPPGATPSAPRDYKALNAMVRKHKSALTKAEKTKDPQKMLAVAQAALDEFEKEGIWPDNWALWQRAKDDALFAIQRAGYELPGKRITAVVKDSLTTEPTPPAAKPAAPDRIRRIQIQDEGIQVTFPDKIHTDLFALRSRFKGLQGGGPDKAAQLTADLKRVADAFGFQDQAQTMRASEAYRDRVVELAKQAIKNGKTQFDAPKHEAKPEVKAGAIADLSESDLDAMLDDAAAAVPKAKPTVQPEKPKAAAPRRGRSLREAGAVSGSIVTLREEIKKLKQGIPVAEDMAMNDKGKSLGTLQAKISEAQSRLDSAMRGQVEAPEAPRQKTAADIIKEAAAQGVSGADEALKGLSDLFGGGATLGSGIPSFDEATYAKAKPHFQSAYDQFKKAGKSLKEFLQFIFTRFGEAIRPYLKRFVQEMQALEKEQNERPPGERPGERPVGEGPPDLAAGPPTGLPAPTGAEAKPPAGTGGSRRAGGAQAPSPPASEGDPAGTGGGTGAGEPGTAGSGAAGRPATPEREGVQQDRGNAEVRRGPDIEPTDNLRIQASDQIVPASRASRITANLAAWELSKTLVAENRLPTPDEKRILMQFSGWGDTFQVFGLTKIGAYHEAGDVQESVNEGRQVYNVLYNAEDQKAFANWQKQYGKAYEVLKARLSEAEWDSAKGSALNAHYTSREGIEGLWEVVKHLGWTGGTAVESSAGIGHIMGLTPDAFAGKVHWVGVELDKMTAQMLRQLYPASDIQNVGFEKSLRTENNSANLVISNFPFGDYPVVDIKHPDYDGWSIHNYFLARSVDTVKPGGLVVAITSRFTLDGAKGRPMRDWLASRADLIGAIRLPDTAFKTSAGTEVVTDILVFRKKTGVGNLLGQRFNGLAPVVIREELRGKKKLKDETDEAFQARIAKPVLVNEYFAEHPEMVLGEHSTKGSMYGGDAYTVTANADASLKEQLAQAVAKLPANIAKAEDARIEEEDQGAPLETIAGKKADSYVEKDGKVWQVDDQGRLQKPEWASSTAQVAIAKKLMGLRDSILKQIDLELSENSAEEDIEAGRKELNRLYDDFVSKRGALNENKNNLIDDDPEWPLVAGLEEEKSVPVEKVVKGKTITRFARQYEKGWPLLHRFNYPRTEPVRADNLRDAISISINYRGGINADYVGTLLGITAEEARQRAITEELAYENPATGLLETPDLYLSGFVKKKLEEARRAVATETPGEGETAKFARNVAALEKVQPKPLPAEKIYFRLGSNWITSEQVRRFLRAVLDIDIPIQFVRAADETRWIVGDPRHESVANSKTFSAGGVPGHKLVEDALNLKLTEVSTTWEDEKGNKHTEKMPKETAAARDMQDTIQEAFRKWATSNPAEATEVEDTYNRLFNGLVRREYPVPSFDRFPGASDAVQLRDWQKRGAVRAVQEGTLFAHSVGTGKTYTLITAAMEMRRLGTARKPVIVVQNSTLTQFANSFRRLYPTARILVGNAKATAAKKRKGFVARVATGDWDAVVLPMSFFERIENDPDREQAYVHEQLDALEAMIREAEGPNYKPDKRPSSSLGKQLIKVKRRFEAKMTRILDRLAAKSDDLITFEKLGVDALLVDEAHNFKRGDFSTKMERIKGLDT